MADVEAGLNELVEILIRKKVLNRTDQHNIKHKILQG